MTTDNVQQIWNDYLNAYADVAADERERLLRQSVSDDIVFTSPTGEGQGFGNLVEHISQFQKKSPGAYFKNNTFLTHHSQLLAEWTLCGKDGSAVITGHTFARLDEQNRLVQLAGFFKV